MTLIALLAIAAPFVALAADIVTVFAAASLKNALDEVSSDFETATGHDVSVSLAGSSVLARQIQNGAPADVYICANPKWMDVLEKEGLIDPETRFDLLENSLVLIAHDREANPVDIGPGTDLWEMLGDGHLAMALVDAVPAGIYGKAALETLGLWNSVAARVAQVDNVRAALALVSTGEAPLGIVYATDASADKNVAIIGTFPADSHPPIIYPAAAVAHRDNPLQERFLAFLTSPSARDAFERHGFVFVADQVP